MSDESDLFSNPLSDDTCSDLPEVHGTRLVLPAVQALPTDTPAHQQSIRERDVRLDERRKERERIARELHDTLFQGFVGASMMLDAAVDQIPADSPSKPSFGRILHLMRRVLDEGRLVLHGLRSPEIASTSLEQALADFRNDFAPGGAPFRIFVSGQPKTLKPEVQEQIYWIAREALVNALRHSEATSIEAEVEYGRHQVRIVVRDNGCGIDPQELCSRLDSHWGLLGMHERAQGIGAHLRIWSRPGSGTEVELSISSDTAVQAHTPVEVEAMAWPPHRSTLMGRVQHSSIAN